MPFFRKILRDDRPSANRICRQVTVPWLQEVLTEYYSKRNPKQVKVAIKSHYVIQAPVVSDALLSDVITISIQAKINKEPQTFDFIVKLLPYDQFTRFFVSQVQFDLREVQFYNQVITDFKKLEMKILKDGEPPVILPVAKCYLAKYIKSDLWAYGAQKGPTNKIEESFIILENLIKKGYNRTNFLTGLTPEEAESAFDAISRIHALSLVMKIHEEIHLNEKYDFFFQTQRAANTFYLLVETAFPQVRAFVEKRGDMIEIMEPLDIIKNNARHLLEYLLKPKASISAITHNNFWLNNLFFKDNKCAIFDWQLVTYSQPTNDLAFLIMTSLTPQVRIEHESRLLDYYWTRLNYHGTKLHIDIAQQFNYNPENLREDYKKSKILALLLCVGSIEIELECEAVQDRLIAAFKDMYKDGILTQEFINGLGLVRTEG